MLPDKAVPLYTPAILGLAVELARFPLDPSLPHQGSARSASCGSTLDLGLGIDEAGRVETVGLRVAACAIGQASAAIFARHAAGMAPGTITATRTALGSWLAGEAALPDWPELELIVPALSYPARHGAILLPWNAAAQALSKL